MLCLQGTLRFSPAKLGARSYPEAQSTSIADRIGDNSGVTHPLCFTLFCKEHTQHSFHGHRMACSDYAGIPPWLSHRIPPKDTIISKSTELVPISACYGSSNQAVIGWSCLQRNENVFCTSFPCTFSMSRNTANKHNANASRILCCSMTGGQRVAPNHDPDTHRYPGHTPPAVKNQYLQVKVQL